MKFELPLTSPLKDLGLHCAAWACLLLVLQLVVAIFPNPELDNAVAARYPDQVALVMSARSSSSGSHTFARRSYILLPRFFAHPAFVEARKVDSGTTEVSEDSRSAVVTGLLFLVACGIYFGRRWRVLRQSR